MERTPLFSLELKKRLEPASIRKIVEQRLAGEVVPNAADKRGQLEQLTGRVRLPLGALKVSLLSCRCYSVPTTPSKRDKRAENRYIIDSPLARTTSFWTAVKISRSRMGSINSGEVERHVGLSA